MRLNRSTLLLLVACIAIIAAVLLLNNNQAEAPEPEAASTEEAGGPLFPDLAADDVVSLAVRDNETEAFTKIAREEATEGEPVWAVTGPEDAADRTVNQEAAAGAINNAAALEASDSFEIDDLEAFGLASPAFTVELDTGDETLSVLFIGNQNPTGNRYYVMARQIDAAAGEDTSPELSEGSTVFLVNTNPVEQITDLVADPPFDPLPTATPTATATLNPMSEVEMATATAEAGATATAEMDAVLATMTAEAESTEEATAEVTEESE